MKYRIGRFIIGAVALILAQQTHAAKILYFYDEYLGADYWSQALTARGDTVTTVTNGAAFTTQLTAGAPWDAVVVSENNYNTSSTWAAAFQSYVQAQGRAVLNDWYTNSTIDAATEAVAAAPVNQSSCTVNATGIAGGLLTGGVTNPITLTNPSGGGGWGVFSMALTPSGTAASWGAFATGSCLVFANAGRTLRLSMIPDTLPAAQASQFLQNALSAVLGAQGLAAPTNAVATAGQASATVQWTASTSPGITGYTVTSEPGGLTCTAAAPATSCTVAGLSSGTSYTFTVVASNGQALSPPSAPSNAVIPTAVAAASALPVPTLSEWAKILLVLSMLGVAGWHWRRHETDTDNG
ncbi:IPTL-CTERM sorting domain-containing protein [uncultured Thiodictyon sp.]|jgi:hypothetical protein|uniref:IPTL-CTERM sorting domain-containing protein n=1 Tax=uncultured Thiodictyon sp. TaxID=1846217 RepID=UPI0025F1DE75|nr:IPTL-CTERM sorting domain-containing protein [uncultured Thiodictyon sp.]